MNNFSIKLLQNPFVDVESLVGSEIISDTLINQIMNFHKSLPSYKATPTLSLNSLARKLKLKNLFVKDESKRFDLNAFKVLGASYAMAKILTQQLDIKGGILDFSEIKQLGIKSENLDFSEIRQHQEQYKELVFITTTDGNHGRAVAWAAEKFGCRAIVYMPKGSSPHRLQAIKEYGAEAYISELGYDDCVNFVSELAKENNWLLLQDTSWPGYQQIPCYIMQGYFSLISEFLEQYPEQWPSHVFVQAGVGSLAASLAICLRFFQQRSMPIFVVVEPTGAPCFYESIKISDGNPHRSEGELNTIMAGLACGEPGDFAWNVLKKLTSAFVVCEDEIAISGMKVAAFPETGDAPIVSGESGAVTIGVVNEIMSNPSMEAYRQQLKLDQFSSILLISTEGDSDPEIYRSLIL